MPPKRFFARNAHCPWAIHNMPGKAAMSRGNMMPVCDSPATRLRRRRCGFGRRAAALTSMPSLLPHRRAAKKRPFRRPRLLHALCIPATCPPTNLFQGSEKAALTGAARRLIFPPQSTRRQEPIASPGSSGKNVSAPPGRANRVNTSQLAVRIGSTPQASFRGPEAGAPARTPAACFRATLGKTSGAVRRRWTKSHQSLPERKLCPLPPWDLASGSFFCAPSVIGANARKP